MKFDSLGERQRASQKFAKEMLNAHKYAKQKIWHSLYCKEICKPIVFALQVPNGYYKNFIYKTANWLLSIEFLIRIIEIDSIKKELKMKN
jgi:hypothetical protein